jgi:hypothetical protein
MNSGIVPLVTIPKSILTALIWNSKEIYSIVKSVLKQDDVSTFEALVNAGLDVSAYSYSTDHIVTCCCVHDAVKCLSFLIKMDRSFINKTDPFGNSPLAVAIVERSIKCVEYLTDLGASVFEINKTGDTPLSLATSANPDRKNAKEIKEIILSAGLNSVKST